MGYAAMQKRVLAIAALLALLSGCGDKKDEMITSAASPGKSPLPHSLATGEKVYRNTCSLCHRLGVRGAPRLGDTEDWVLRLAQGKKMLYDHAVYGYRGSSGNMPSRGSNARLSEDEVKAAVDYMVWYSVPKPEGLTGSHRFPATVKQFTIR